MILDVALFTLFIIFLALYINTKSELIRTKKKLKDEKHKPNGTEDFTLGFSKLTSEFPDQILKDPLTLLPGRAAFEDRLLQAINQSERFKKSFGVILLDIRELSLINKAQGYELGDKLLKEVAKRLQKMIRQIDTISRFAGGIFVFLLPQLAMPETAVYVAQRLLDSIVQPFSIDDQEFFITANVGVAIYPIDGEDSKTLLKHANEALHESKLKGPGKYQFYQQEMHALGEKELAINAAVCTSNLLTTLLLRFQPYVDIRKNTIIGIHAIPYVQLSESGEIVPFNEFAKTAENCGKIMEIGEWALTNAVKVFKEWKDETNRPDKIAMNVTIRQIENPQFIYKVSQILEENEMDPAKIIFEVREQNLLSQTDSLDKAFEMMNQIGVKISLSLFALGHLALQKITNLPVHYLKIDSRLIDQQKSHEENDVILNMVITLAKEMKIIVIAEGVDNEIKKNTLEELGCNIMQGKLFGEAIAAENLTQIDLGKS